MQQETHRQISAAERSACRKRLEQVWKSRTMDESRLHRAWQTVYEVAALLYEQFDTIQVVAFGSLTEPMWFTTKSDIDLAVSGLSSKDYDKAWTMVFDFRSEFKIDCVNFDTSEGLFRERIKHQAIAIEKGACPPNSMTNVWQALYQHLQRQVFPTEDGDIYEMNRKRLTQRINDELVKIDATVSDIAKALIDIDVLPVAARPYIEESIANKLADVYNGVERIFERIAREVDTAMPTGSRWHKDLLAQMTTQRPERGPVISEGTSVQLEGLLEFRHKVNNIYDRELNYEMTEPHAKSIDALLADVSQDLKTFTDSLKKTDEDA